jgi:gamma-glutamyl-gamma-aminobutyrate hydrolase PuuD
MQNEVADDLINGVPWYRHEFDLIRTTDKPILGLCLGLQMINVALGGTLKKLDNMVLSYDKQIELTQIGKQYLGNNQLCSSVHEKHQWVVDSYQGTNLQLIGYSEDGVELLYYPKRQNIRNAISSRI